MATEFASLERRVRWLDWLFRLTEDFLPGTEIGRPLLRDLIVAYEHADDGGRRHLRTVLRRRVYFVRNVGLGLPRPVASPESFRQHLLHFSLIFLGDDPRDLCLWLHDLCHEALAAGVTIEPILRQVAEISSDDGEGIWSAREQLLARIPPAPKE